MVLLKGGKSISGGDLWCFHNGFIFGEKKNISLYKENYKENKYITFIFSIFKNFRAYNKTKVNIKLLTFFNRQVAYLCLFAVF